MDERDEQHPPTSSIRSAEQVLGAPALRASGAPDRTLDGVPPDAPAAGLDIAFYPERLERRESVTLSPSQAVRYADDPHVRAAAASTAGSRQVMGAEERLSLAALWVESDPTDRLVARPVPPIPAAPPREAPTSASLTPAIAEGTINAACSEQIVRDLPEPEEQPAAVTPAEPDPKPTAPERTRPWWEAARPQHAAPRRPWWKRLLGLGR